MSFDLAPVELAVAALTAVLLGLSLAFPLAASAIVGPRRSWNRAGLAMGLGLLVGVLLASVGAFLGPAGPFALFSGLALLLGLTCAVVAAVLVIVLEDGTGWAAAIGITACALIGLGEPLQTVPALFGLSTSVLVVLAGVVVEAAVLVVVVGFLVAAAGRVRVLQIGIAVAGAVGALLTGLAVLLHLAHELLELGAPAVPLGATLIATLIALVLGSIGGALLETVRTRRRAADAPQPGAVPAGPGGTAGR